PASSGTTYRIGARIVPAIVRTYYWDSSRYQLMVHQAASGVDAPVVDHVVGLSFEYYGDPLPPMHVRPLTDIVGPWTTYGPRPPTPGSASTGYPTGENCVFALGGGGYTPRLGLLGDPANPSALVRLPLAELMDGPWCPDPTDARRWDADLLRIRKVAVTLRVEAAIDAL